MAAAAIGATLAALIVRWEPLAAGSGIQHVEAVFLGEARPPLIRLVPAKFIGGVLSMGSGLVLGREGARRFTWVQRSEPKRRGVPGYPIPRSG